MEDLVLWKPLYYTSIGMFILSLILFPFTQNWSIIIVFALVSLWSRIPGFIHFIFNQLTLNDFFTFIIAAHVNGLVGGLFGAFNMLSGLIFGPNQWPPYIIRGSIALFIAGLSTPLIINFVGSVSLTTFFIYEGLVYAIYYALVLLFSREEIGIEITVLPAVIFFDFFMNAFLFKSFGNFLDSLVTGGISGGWPFLIFAGVILGFVLLSKNANKIGKPFEKFFGSKDSEDKVFYEEIKKE